MSSPAALDASISRTHGPLRRTLGSSLGAKIVMASTGLIFFAWLVLHLLGNLGVFAGRETENTYAHFLKGNPEILWAQRAVWMIIFPIHIFSGIRLARLNAAARPQPYASPRNWRQATLASRTMIISGLIVLAFFLFHLAHFTEGWILRDHFGDDFRDASGRADVYGMVTTAFQNPLVACIYLIGVTSVGMHLSHGVWSGTHSLGLAGPRWTPLARKVGFIVGVGIALGFASIPIVFAFGGGVR